MRAPVANVQILALYNSESGIGHSETVCYRVETLITGADGRYEFPAGRGHGPIVEIFKPGYTEVPNPRYVDQRWAVVNGKEEPRFVAVEVDRNTKPQRILWEKAYPTRAEAEVAARVNERYMKLYTDTHAKRFAALWNKATTDCTQARDTRSRVVPYLSAVYSEMEQLAQTKQENETLARAKAFIEMEKTAR